MGSACSIKRVSNQVAPTILELNINENNAQTPKIVFLGIDGSGKSTIITWLERSELGESNHDTFYNPIPKPSSHSSTVTNANNVNVVNCLNNQILLIDVPGNPSQRKYSWINLASKPGVIMIVYVIDQCDVLRYPVARQELLTLIEKLNVNNVQCSISIVINNKVSDNNNDDGGGEDDDNAMIVNKNELKQLLNDVNKVIGSNNKRIITMSTINNATDVQNLAVNLYPTMQERINIE